MPSGLQDIPARFGVLENAFLAAYFLLLAVHRTTPPTLPQNDRSVRQVPTYLQVPSVIEKAPSLSRYAAGALSGSPLYELT